MPSPARHERHACCSNAPSLSSEVPFATGRDHFWGREGHATRSAHFSGTLFPCYVTAQQKCLLKACRACFLPFSLFPQEGAILSFFTPECHIFHVRPQLSKVFKPKLYLLRTADVLNYLTGCRPKQRQREGFCGNAFQLFSPTFSALLKSSLCSLYGLQHVVHHFGIFVTRWSLVMETQL